MWRRIGGIGFYVRVKLSDPGNQPNKQTEKQSFNCNYIAFELGKYCGKEKAMAI